MTKAPIYETLRLMDAPDKPIIRALVGIMGPAGLAWWKLVTLEEAARYHELGAMVLVDPDDEMELATWERSQRFAALPRRGR